MGNTCASVMDNICGNHICAPMMQAMGNTGGSVMDNVCGNDHEKITVLLRSACGLPEANWRPGIDRFLYVGVGEDVGGREIFKTQLKKNVVDPVWNEECHLPAGTLLA